MPQEFPSVFRLPGQVEDFGPRGISFSWCYEGTRRQKLWRAQFRAPDSWLKVNIWIDLQEYQTHFQQLFYF